MLFSVKIASGFFAVQKPSNTIRSCMCVQDKLLFYGTITATHNYHFFVNITASSDFMK